MNTRCLSLILLLLCFAVPLASAGGMAKIYLSPDEANWKTGQTVQVKVMFDNNLNPVAKDISLYFDWNAEMLKYESTDFKVGHSTVAGLLSPHELNVMVGDFTNGYKNGDYPLAVLNFKVIGPGDTPILVKVARLNNMDGKPVTFSASKGSYSITGAPIAGGTVKPTTRPAAGQATLVVVTPATTYTLIPGITQPVAATTTVQSVQPAQVGGAPGWPVMTYGATIPTVYPAALETTFPTVIPTTVVTTTVPTTAPTTFPTTTVRTTWPTPTAEPITVETTWPTATPTTVSPIAYQTGNLGYSAGIPIYDTPTPNDTPTVNRTLPSPLANNTSNLTEEPTVAWPLDGMTTVTTVPTLYIRTTATTAARSAINNSSAALAPAGTSLVGDTWMIALAAFAGVVIVGLGVVTIRRSRDDDL